MRDGGEGGEDHEAHRGLSSRRLLDAVGKPMAREAEGKSALILAVSSDLSNTLGSMPPVYTFIASISPP